MTKYERYTSKDGATLTMSQWGGSLAELELYRKLAEVEDKIDNGTLIEFPITDKDILEDYAHKIFDAWNDITGALNKNCSWYYEALWVIDDIVGMVWGITSRQYEARLRELQGERE